MVNRMGRDVGVNRRVNELTLAHAHRRSWPLPRGGWGILVTEGPEANLFSIRHHPGLDMILLDRGLPDGDGVDLLRDLRTIGIRTPVILISASVGLGDRILGLEAGADDYLPKPFAPAELVARCQAVWRRGKSFNELPLHAGNLTLRLDTLDVAVNGRPIVLSARQIRLLIALLQHQGRPCPRAHLRSVCTTPGQKSAPNSLEASICRLRAALQEAGASVSIGTARGIGYILRSTTKAMQDNLCETFKSSGQSANVSVE
jgi:DNA-binding response OmpR family regulator